MMHDAPTRDVHRLPPAEATLKISRHQSCEGVNIVETFMSIRSRSRAAAQRLAARFHMHKATGVITFAALVITGGISSAASQALPRPQRLEVNIPSQDCMTATSPYYCIIRPIRVPTTSRVVFDMVSCYIESSVPITQMSLGPSVTESGYTIKNAYVSLPSPVFSRSRYVYNFSSPISLYVAEGRYMVFQVASRDPGTSKLSCLLGGDLETP